MEQANEILPKNLGKTPPTEKMRQWWTRSRAAVCNPRLPIRCQRHAKDSQFCRISYPN